MREQRPYDYEEDFEEDDFEEASLPSGPARRVKAWILLSLSALLLLGGMGIHSFIKNPDQAVKRLQTLSDKQEVTFLEAVKGGKDVRLLLDAKEYKYANFLMDTLEKEKVHPNLKTAILKEFNESNQKFINYDAVMQVYLAHWGEETDQEAIRVLSFNQSQENERIFLRQAQHLLPEKEEELLDLVLQYKKDRVGAVVQIYDLDFSLKFLAKAYTQKKLSQEEFKSFIRGKDTQEVIAVFYAEAKKSLEAGNYEFARALVTEPAKLAVLVVQPYDEGFAFMQEFLNEMREIEKLRAESTGMENQISSMESHLTSQQEQVDFQRTQYESQAAELKKLQSSLGQYAPFELSGKIVNVLESKETDYGTAQTYEGAYVRHNFFGEVLSAERFLLRTYKSSLQRDDSFVLEVISSGTVEMEQEGLLSTYQQRWPVYDEFTDAMKHNVNQLAGDFKEIEARTKEQKALYDEENAKLQTLLKEKTVWEEKRKQAQEQMEQWTQEAEALRLKIMAID